MRKLFTLLCLLMAFQVSLFAQPANDECANAVTLIPAAIGAGPSYINATSINATRSEPACDGQLITDDDVWFKFTATTNAHRINIRGFLQNAGMVEAYSGTCAAKILLNNCGDFSNGSNPGFVNLGGLTPGTEYFFRVFSVFNSAASASNFEVAVTSTTAPANDGCEGAITLAVNGPTCQTPFSSSLTDATSSAVALCGTINKPNHLYRDVWFKFVATAKAHLISTTLPSQVQRDIQVFSGTCNALTTIGCLSTSSFSDDVALGSLVPGETYFVRVGSSLIVSSFDICISTPVFDANDDCSSAIEIQSSGNSDCIRIFGNLANASQSGISCATTTIRDPSYDQWYKFIATETQYRLRLGTAQNVRIRMEVLQGLCGGSLTAVPGGSCTTVTTANDTTREAKITGLIIGNTYFVRVAAAKGSGGAYNLCLKNVVPPVNDNCPGAKELTIAESMETMQTLTTTNLLDVTQSSPGCLGSAEDDLWYTFEASSANIGALTVLNFLDPHVLQVFTGPCDNLVQVSCTQLPNNTSARASFQLLNLTSGTRYRMRMHGAGNFAVNTGAFTQSIGLYKINSPSNNACANAITLTPSPGNTCNGTSSTTVDATNTRAACNDANSREVWFRFEATATSHFLQIWGALYDPRIELLQGTCNSLTSIVCFTDATPQIGRRQFNNLVPGTTYFIKVSSNEAFIDREGIFSICLTTPATPANDECSGAITIPVCSTPACDPQGLFSTNLATQSRPNCVGGVTANDVWFKFSTDKAVTIAINNLNAQIRKEVFTGTCDNLTSILCTNLHVNDLPKPTGMTDYFVRVYNNASGVVSTEFTMKIFETSDIKVNATLDTICLKTNAVLNPSFEFASACPTGFIGSATAGGLLITNWRFPTTGTSDFFNACQTTGGNTVHIPTNQCFGTQEPRSGRGYVGLFAMSTNNYREYIQGELSAPMVPGKKYLVSFYVSLAEYSNTAIDRMGIHFKIGSTAISNSGPLSFTPQLESTPGAILNERKGWVNISGIVEPTEAFTHFIIGNFRNNATTNTQTVLDESSGLLGGTAPGCGGPGIQGYYFIDDVFVGEVDETAGASCGTLPVTWLSFSANKVNADAHLDWRTAQEQRCSLYEVERSSDGINYQKVGQQLCRNTQATQNYSFVDINPGKGTFYYRLRQVDTDGKFEYSAVRTVSFGQDNEILMYPNPTRNLLQITGLQAKSDINVYDAGGRRVFQTRSGQPMMQIQVGHLPAGIYQLTITQSNGEQSFHKIQIVK